MPHKRLVFLYLGIPLVVMLTPLWILAQDQPPAPQFLYINENHLILLNGYTGQTTILPINITAGDHFTWSPDGKYIVANLASKNASYFCLNLYDVDQQKWIQDKPISCEVHDFIFTNDGSALYYTFDNETNGILQKYSVKDKTSHKAYETDKGANYSDGISDLRWSPTGAHLTFKDYHWIMGGTLNTFIIMNVETEKYATVSAPETYYADYSPIWSADEDWFLIILQDKYITSFAIPMSNDKGDLYLVNTKTGKQYRQTYTPAEPEIGIHWTDDGKIAFTEVSELQFTYGVDQAMNIEVVPPDKIVTPEPIGDEARYNPLQDIMISPDPNIGAWIKQPTQSDKTSTYELAIGEASTEFSDVKFSVPISDPYQSGAAILIGWRPAQYPYPQN